MDGVVQALLKLLSDPKPLTLVGLALVCLTVALIFAIIRVPRTGRRG